MAQPATEELKRTPNKPNGLPTRQNTNAAYTNAQMATIQSFVDVEYVDRVAKALDGVMSCSDPDKDLWHAIIDDTDVIAAHRGLQAVMLVDPLPEYMTYNPIALLCNRISSAYAIHSGANADDIIIFTSPHETIIRGDFMDALVKSDFVSFRGSGTELEIATLAQSAHPTTPYMVTRPWPSLSSIGESKPRPKPNGFGQAKKYIVHLKRYLPHLPAVHSFYAEKTLTLFSLNTCGMWESPPLELTDLSAWVAHVILVYRSYGQRNTSLESCFAQKDFIRWDSTTDDQRHVLVPFHVGPVPGRMTWGALKLDDPDASYNDDDPDTAAYTRAYREHPPAGFVKVAWQDKKRLLSEGQLLFEAHKSGWIPGLVRPHSYTPHNADQFISAPGTDVERVEHTLHLASVGQPLSRCTDYLHLLKVMYDGIETHLHLLEQGILHRDISWANVLCHPRHLPVGEIDRNSLDRPCISQLLGDANSEPCVLLADLDHAARWADLHGRVHPRRNEKTGTPSWISVELASKVAYTIPYAVDKLKQIYRRFEQYKDNALFLAAFPRRDVPSSDGKGVLSDDGFLENFATVIAKERKRYLDDDSPDWQPRLTTYPATAHVPRHDCESYYWIQLYHLARAYPLGDADKPSLIPPPAVVDDAQKMLETFATAMLEHEVGQEGDRQKYLYGFDHQAGVLHPKLQGCAPLLQDLAAYLCVPWHLYEKGPNDKGAGFVELNHVHHAFRRLILLEIIQLTQANPAIPNVRFSTAGPRRLRPKIIDRTKGTPSQSAPESGAKRGRSNDEGDDHDHDSDPKRLKTAQPAVVEMRRSSRLASLGEGNNPVRTDTSHDDIIGLLFDADDSDSFDEDTHDDSGTFALRKRVKKAARDPADATVAECIQYYHNDARWFSTGVQAKK